MSKDEVDISEGIFYSKWPHWLRWTLFIPSAFIGCLITSTLFNIIVNLFVTNPEDGSLNHGWYNLISSAVLGITFVGIAAYIAPKNQFEVSICMSVVLAVVLSGLFIREYDFGLFQQTQDLLYYLMHNAVTLIGGVGTVFYIRQLVEEQANKVHYSKRSSSKVNYINTEGDDELSDWED